MPANPEKHRFGMVLSRVVTSREKTNARWRDCILTVEPEADRERIGAIMVGLRAKFAGLRATVERKRRRFEAGPQSPPPSNIAINQRGQSKRIIRKGDPMS